MSFLKKYFSRAENKYPKLFASGYEISAEYLVFILNDVNAPQENIVVNKIEELKKNIALSFSINEKEIQIICEDGVFVVTNSFQKFEDLPKDNRKHLILEGIAHSQRHKLKKKNTLFKSLGSSQASLPDLLKSAKDYTHTDICSIWVHNKYTEHQVCIASDKEYLVGKYLTPEEDNNKVYEFIKSGEAKEQARVDVNAAYSLADDGMKSMTRFRIDFGNETIGVFSFASKYEDYYIRDDTGAIVTALAVNAYQIEHRPIRESILEFTSILRNEPEENVANICMSVCEKVAGLMSFEACSVFMPSENELEVVASYDSMGPVTQMVSGYPLGQESLTVDVFDSGEVRWSYKIKEETKSHNGYSEICQLEDTNWIAVPIFNEHETPIGVIRVKNKFRHICGEKSIAPLRVSDFTLLISVSSALGIRIGMHHTRMHLEAEVEQQKLDLLQFQDHQRILFHEFRAPAHAFMNTPEDIRDLVQESSATEVQKQLIEREVDDLLVVAERLDFIIKCHRREHLFRNVRVTKLFVLQDIIMPVVSTYERYLRKQWGIKVSVNASFLSSRLVRGDIDLLSIVMNILLDNAGKYSRSKKNIRISGELDKAKSVVRIFVQNDGYEILEPEVEKVFDDNFRGSNVRGKKIDGTGIGLNLAKDILDRLNSKIYVKSRSGPVIFVVELPEVPR